MNEWSSGWRRVLLHLLFWSALVAAYAFSAYVRGYLDRFWFGIIRLIPIDIALVYVNAYLLLPKLLLKKKWAAFVLSFLGVAILGLLLMRFVSYYYVMPVVYPDGLKKPFFYYPEYLFSAIMTYSFVFLFSGVRLFKTWLQDHQKRQELETRNLSGELALLRSQVNPHFLFNTLNNIDTLVFKDQQKASDSIVKLSEIMRYMLYESNTEKVPLGREVNYLESMVELIRLRLKDPDFIRFELEGDPQSKEVPPMLLVPFIENAYKHGKKQGPAPGIYIRLEIHPEELRFHISNLVEAVPQESKDGTGGIGLQNVRRRLELLYGDAYELKIIPETETFKVFLKIPA